jgi:hypothetical protein
VHNQRFALGFVLFTAAALILLFGDKTCPTAGAVALAIVGFALMLAAWTTAGGHSS